MWIDDGKRADSNKVFLWCLEWKIDEYQWLSGSGWQLVVYFVVAVAITLKGASHVAASLVVGEGWRCLCFLCYVQQMCVF